MGMRSTRGEIVQVQGGHIVRSAGRKDRHSKVYTAKGPRDRRVRLSAHTAIQFYDVQDRLGYDRPSKAVDWLIKKAKSAIDKLAELPPWQPTAANGNPNLEADQDAESNRMAAAEHSESAEYNFQFHRQLIDTPSNSHSFITGAIDPDGIPDTMKSLLPTSSAASSMNFQSYPAEDLGLSLHSFQDQSLIPGQSQPNNGNHAPQNEQTLFSGSAPAGFESNFQRIAAWGNDTGAGNRAAVGFAFNQAEPFPPHQPSLLGHGSAFSHRGTLQSSFLQSFRAWNDLPMASSDHNRTQELHPSLIFGSSFAQEGMLGFSHIPGHIHGEEEQSVVSDRPSSSSPNSQQ